MLFTKRHSLYFIGLFFYSTLSAQIDRNIIPLGLGLTSVTLQDLPAHTYSAPAENYTPKLAKQSSYPRMGTTLNVAIDLVREGDKFNIAGNTCLLYKVSILNAKGLVPYFRNYHLGQGSVLHVYAPDKGEWIGAFTAANNTADGQNSLGLFCGSEMILEYCPGKNAAEDILLINEIGVAMHNVPQKRRSSPEFGSSASCEVNVNCPEGDDWQHQKRAVARIMVKTGNEFGWCSGTMVNNTANNCTPFLLTADHCGLKSNGSYASSTDFNQWTFYFNYESPDCNNPSSDSFLVDDFLVGSSRIAYSQDQGGDNGSDFLLVRLKQRPDSLYNTYYAGWSAFDIAPDSCIGIHHPSADIKKISKCASPAHSVSWGGIISDTHWRISWFPTVSGFGITEEGSSGSAIFNHKMQIVGTLTGGNSFCNTPTAPDDYGKFSYHWNSNGSAIQRQLQTWLDSLNTGLLEMDGRDKCLSSIPNSVNAVENDDLHLQLYPNPNQGVFTVQSRAHIEQLFVFDIAGKLIKQMEGNERYILSDLKAGVYTIKVIAGGKATVKKMIVVK